MRRHFARGILVLSVLGVAAACGESSPPKAAVRAEVRPRWADVFDGVPDFYAVIRPQAIRRDGVYGAFFKALIRAAEARGVARGDRMVAALEGAEEIIVGLDKRSDAAVVLRGVPASLDPQKITDAEGHALFRSTTDRAPGKVTEYAVVDRRAAEEGALFVLEGRTWVGALGPARARARAAFASPMNRPAPEVDGSALAVVRIEGALAHVLDRHPAFGPLTKKLARASFSLMPGKGGVVVALAYEDAADAAWAEMHAKALIDELARGDGKLGESRWLKEAKVAYEDKTLFVRVAVPPRLLEELPNASGADFGFDER